MIMFERETAQRTARTRTWQDVLDVAWEDPDEPPQSAEVAAKRYAKWFVRDFFELIEEHLLAVAVKQLIRKDLETEIATALRSKAERAGREWRETWDAEH